MDCVAQSLQLVTFSPPGCRVTAKRFRGKRAAQTKTPGAAAAIAHMLEAKIDGDRGHYDRFFQITQAAPAIANLLAR